jgi:putative ABC transport system permease protein
MVDLAVRNLLHDKLRFVITVCGVAFAVALVFVQTGLFIGLLENASVTIEHMPAEIWVAGKNTPNVDFGQPFPEGLVQRVRSVPGVARADNLLIWYTRVALSNGAQEGNMVYALDNFERWNFPWNITEGSVRDLKRGRYVMIDSSAEKRFGAFELGEYREINGRRFKIVGRTADAVSFTTTPIFFMDYAMLQLVDNGNLAGKTTFIIVKLEPGANVETVRMEIQRRLPYNDVHTSAEWAEKSKAYWVESTGLGLNMIMTVFLGCLVGLVVVAQTLYASTMEHIREFGTVKAIGGGNMDIYRILGKQATISAVMGYLLGAGLSHALAPAMAQLDLKLVIPPSLSIAIFVGTLVLCLASAGFSFNKVASIDPALVFRN